MRVSLLLVILIFSADEPGFAQWTMGAYLGWAAPFRTDVAIHDPVSDTNVRLDRVQFRTRSFHTPIYYGIRAGHGIGRRFAAELELTHLKIFADVDSPVRANGTINATGVTGMVRPRSFLQQLNVSHGLNLVLGNLVTRFPINDRNHGPARIILTARFGVGPTLSHVEADLLGMATSHYESGGVATQAAGGLEFPIRNRWHIVIEYKYTYTRQHVDVGSAAVKLSPATQHVVTGVGYRF